MQERTNHGLDLTVFGRGKAKSRPGVITAPTHKSA